MVYYLLKNPEAMRKLREEVDTLVGDHPMTIDHIHKLPYLIGESPSRIIMQCGGEHILT